MTTAYVHSGYERIADDDYQTIDVRLIDSLLGVFNPFGKIVDVCAPNGSGIVNILRERGYDAGGATDAFDQHLECEWVITNPPYKRGLVDSIIEFQIGHVLSGRVKMVAALMRANWDLASGRGRLFDRMYAGQIRMRFRPWWSKERKAQPIHNFVWHIWSVDAGEGLPVIWYSK